MIHTAFPINATLLSMSYGNNEELAIIFRKGQTRTYSGVGQETAYKLFYLKTASDVMRFYALKIKKKYKVTVKK